MNINFFLIENQHFDTGGDGAGRGEDRTGSSPTVGLLAWRKGKGG